MDTTNRVYWHIYKVGLMILFFTILPSMGMQKSSVSRLARLTPYAKSLYTKNRLFNFYPYTRLFAPSATRHYAIPKHSKKFSEKGKNIINYYLLRDDVAQKLSEETSKQEIRANADRYPSEIIEVFLEAPKESQDSFLELIQSDKVLQTKLKEVTEDQAKKIDEYEKGQKLIEIILGKKYLSGKPPKYKAYTKFSDYEPYAEYKEKTESHSYEEKKGKQERKKTTREELKRKPETVEDLLTQLHFASQDVDFMPGEWITYIVNKNPDEKERIREAVSDAIIQYMSQHRDSEIIDSSICKDPHLVPYTLDVIVTNPDIFFKKVISTILKSLILKELTNKNTAIRMAQFIATNIKHFINNKMIGITPDIIEYTMKQAKHADKIQAQQIFAECLANENVAETIIQKEGVSFLWGIILAIDNQPKSIIDFGLDLPILNAIKSNKILIFSKSNEGILHLFYHIISPNTVSSIESLIRENIEMLTNYPIVLYYTIQKIIKTATEPTKSEIQSNLSGSFITNDLVDKILSQREGALYCLLILKAINSAKPLILYLDKNALQLAMHKELDDFLGNFKYLNLSTQEKVELHNIAMKYQNKLNNTTNGKKLFKTLANQVTTSDKLINWLQGKFLNH